MNLVFASGFLVPERLAGLDYFRGLPEKYPAALFPSVPIVGSVAERAQALAAAIAGHFPAGEVHIIAHSMGGLDARHLLAKNLCRLADPGRVRSLSMISTPHRGSPVADLLVGPKPGITDPRRFAYEILSHVLMSLFSIHIGALGGLTTGAALQFNQDNPDQDNVKYYSYAGSEVQSFLLVPSHKLIEMQGHSADDQTNDGLVSVASAKWPDDSLAEQPWPADHLSEVGYNLNSLDLKSNFDHLAAFERVVQRATTP